MSVDTYQFIQVRESGAQSVIQFRISVNAPTTSIHEVQNEISGFVTRNDCQKLVFDLASTVYLPSNVIGMLASLRAKGIEVHLANASADIVNVMEVMGLNKLIHVNEIEIAPSAPAATNEVERVSIVTGYFVHCTECQSRQRVEKHLLGKKHKCTNCNSDVHIDSDLLNSAPELYCPCPHCERDLQLPADSPTKNVTCEFCGGHLKVRKVL